MATSIITSPNQYPRRVKGQSVVFSTDARTTFPGVLTDGGKVVYITLPTGFNVSSWASAGVTKTVTEMTGSLRGIGGYLRNDVSNIDLLNVEGVNISVKGINVHSVVIGITFTTQITSASNNTPVMYTGTCTVATS